MPCRDDRDDYRLTQNGVAAVAAVRKELEPLLCEACSALEDAKLLPTVSSELKAWYAHHEELEGDRVRYEAALKLSERERRLLGINLPYLKDKLKK